jgi:hypothetical protein
MEMKSMWKQSNSEKSSLKERNRRRPAAILLIPCLPLAMLFLLFYRNTSRAANTHYARLPLVMARLTPGAPILSPVNDSIDGDYWLTWLEPPVQRAEAFIVQEASNSGFTKDVKQVCITLETTCHIMNRGMGNYYYRLQGKNVYGTGLWSNVQDVVINVPPSPVLNEIANTSGDWSYIVSWKSTLNASRYKLEEGKDSSFSNPTSVYSGTELSVKQEKKLNGKHYYRLQALNQWGVSQWSGPELTTVYKPDSPVLNTISDPDKNGIYTPTWNLSAGGDVYTLTEDMAENFTHPITYYAGNKGYYPLGEKQKSGQYFYRVRTGNKLTAKPSEWSNTQSISIPVIASPQLNPIGNLDGDGTYTITWKKIDRATGYFLQEDSSPIFTHPISSTLGSKDVTTYTVYSNPPGTYYYRLAAYNPYESSLWSNTQSATVAPSPPGVHVMDNFTTFSIFHDNQWFRYVLGEVVNNTNAYASNVLVTATFTEAGSIVGVGSSYLHLSSLEPRRVSCFSIVIPEPLSWYTFTFNAPFYNLDGLPRPNLALTLTNFTPYFSHAYRVDGMLRNDESSAVQFPSAVVTLYDKNNAVIGCEHAQTISSTLESAQSSPFTIYAPINIPGDVVTSTIKLQADGIK